MQPHSPQPPAQLWGSQPAGLSPMTTFPLQQLPGMSAPATVPAAVVATGPQVGTQRQLFAPSATADAVPFVPTFPPAAGSLPPQSPQFSQLPQQSGPLLQQSPQQVLQQPQQVQQQVPQPVPQQVQQPTQGQPATTAIGELPSIASMLATFAKQPGCEEYSQDGKRIELISIYLLCRQLVDHLSFDRFLELFTPLADFNEVNLKLPQDAIQALLPRHSSIATKTGRRKWSAKEVSAYLALFVDMLRRAEQLAGEATKPVDLPLVPFLNNTAFQERFLAGEFDEKSTTPTAGVPTAGELPARGKSKKKTTVVATPPAIGQRALYTSPDERQFRGTLMSHDTANHLCTFISDIGERFDGVSLTALSVCTDPPASPTSGPDGQALPVLNVATIRIPKNDLYNVQQALTLPVPIGTVKTGDKLYECSHQFDQGTVWITVYNGNQPQSPTDTSSSGPYVDAYFQTAPTLVTQGLAESIFEANPPRQNLLGVYVFPIPALQGALQVNVVEG